MHKGSCLCGAVTFQSEGPWRDIIYCHCIQCRKTSGHYWASTNVLQAALEITKDDGLTWFRSSDEAERGFCDQCGTSLFYRRFDSDGISISAGVIDGATDMKACEHIFVKDKGDYYTLDDDLPHIEGWT